ncbi:family 16 glycosylhydrolase [Cohnella lubricantis]|uniref:Family 16 glycosylhydrolase n=1 Tax=Cohnella lubricantis TaxID=2163172 RepID=A0A841TCD1_9BACL|nr:family 16 glycosylhydrolase [Cohnella lubricantis]MBB6676900.1 family 16 glycosylhydrolase [Cohnella lubricantis]MBP2118301.1 beta-glucanase (GH16 family) [Cohnella lubricantis]
MEIKKWGIAVLASVFVVPVLLFGGDQSAQAADTPPNPIDKPGWVLTKNDEFNGSTLDTNLWVPRYLGFRTSTDRGNAEYTFRDGSLVLQVNSNTPNYFASGDQMKVSSIQTAQGDFHQASYVKDHNEPYVSHFSQKYGYFEIRAKGQSDRSGHAAFWMNTDDPSIYQQSSRNTTEQLEIDIFENFRRDQYRFNLYNPANSGVGNTNGGTYAFDFSEDYHIYAMEWSPEYVRYYVDNQLVKQLDGTNVVDKPMFVYLSLYVNTWGGDSSPTYPAEFAIDYFRAYQKAESADGVIYQAEDLPTTLSSGVSKETWNDGASGGGWVKILSDSTGDYVDFTANVPSSGEYNVITGYRSATTRGTAQLSINGQDHGSPIDMYGSTAVFKEASTTVNFGSAGNKTFRYRVTGKNSSSTGYQLGIDYIKLVPANNGIVNGATYKIKNLATGKYLDSGSDGLVELASNTIYDDQDWIVTQDSSGYWTIKNARTGRYYLDTDSTNNRVIWNSGEIINDSLWSLESASGGFRVKNKYSGRAYMYGNTANEVKWNTGSADSNTIWVFEKK